MNKPLLITTIILSITACTPEPKVQPKPVVVTTPYVNIENNDSTEMKALKTALSQYTEATIKSDVNKLVSFIYPKAFTIIPKEKMITMLTKAFKAGNVPNVKNVKHLDISKIEKYNNDYYYSIITSSMTTTIKSPRPKDEKFEAYMLTTLQEKLLSRGTVNFDKEKHLFNIEHTNKTIALKEQEGWKFIGFKQARKYIDRGVFPIILIDKIP
jgi:hypothetical protein